MSNIVLTKARAGLTQHDDVLQPAGQSQAGVPRLPPPPPPRLLESHRPVDDSGAHSDGRSRGEEGRVLVNTFRAGGVQAVLGVASVASTSCSNTSPLQSRTNDTNRLTSQC